MGCGGGWGQGEPWVEAGKRILYLFLLGPVVASCLKGMTLTQDDTGIFSLAHLTWTRILLLFLPVQL